MRSYSACCSGYGTSSCHGMNVSGSVHFNIYYIDMICIYQWMHLAMLALTLNISIPLFSALCWGSTTCPNGGICTAPNTCVCRAGWTGSRCTTGTGRRNCSLLYKFSPLQTVCVKSNISALVECHFTKISKTVLAIIQPWVMVHVSVKTRWLVK